MYNKLFTKILDSSIWLAPDQHRLVWITLIASMDEDSVAHFACTENLAARARVSIADTESALAAFQEPDPYDPTQEYEGRRIERVPGGWFLLNGAKYRLAVTRSVMLEQNRARVRRYRERQKHEQDSDLSKNQAGNVTVMHHNHDHKQEQYQKKELSVSARKRASKQIVPREPLDEWFLDFKLAYPERAGGQGWRTALRNANTRLKEGHTTDEMIQGAMRYSAYCASAQKVGTEYVKQAATFLGPDKHFLEPFPCAKPVETAIERIRRLNSAPTGETFEHESPTALANIR